MGSEDIAELVESTIKGIRASYQGKYSELDFEQFRAQAKGAKSKRQLIQLVQNLFDLDSMDARDMVE